jgi:hypothetical protein
LVEPVPRNWSTTRLGQYFILPGYFSYRFLLLEFRIASYTEPDFSPSFSLTVKALYDYQATIEEEFDFQTGDIIAVAATPEDGWWSGELLDEARRQRGRHIFPSNFVCLF